MTEQTSEYQELLNLQKNLNRKSDLESKIKHCDERIEEQKHRKDDLPYFDDPKNLENAKKQVKEKRESRYGVLTLILGVVFFIYAFVGIFFLPAGSIEGLIDFVVCVVCIVIGMVGIFFLWIVYPPVAFFVSAIQNLLGGAMFYYLSSEKATGLFFWRLAQALMVCAVLSLIIVVIIDSVHKKENTAILKKAELMDKKELEKKENDIKDYTARLEKEIPENIAKIEEEKSTYIEKIRGIQKTISLIDVLSPQDKNKHTVDTLVSYFDRKRVSSIKEGINLLLQEERLDKLERETRFAQAQQNAALRRMEEEQEYHNEQMRNLERERNKKLDDAINDIKNRH